MPLINGLAFGGGVGIALLGTHCVAGEGYRFAMPQVGIGFLPDIGGTYFLPRLLGSFGPISPSPDGYRSGRRGRLELASHYIPSAYFKVIKDAISDNHPVDRLLDGLHRDPGEGELVRHTPSSTTPSRRRRSRRSSIARCRAGRGRRLRPRGRGGNAQEVADLAQGGARPDAARRSLELDDALKLEFRLASQIVGSHDYREGVAARIAGKGRGPNGAPRPRRGDDEAIERLFSTQVEDELELETVT